MLRRRLRTLGGFVVAFLLLALLAVVTPQQAAQALPLTGAHSATAYCHQNVSPYAQQKVTINWTSTITGAYNSGRNSYTIHVVSATFAGGTVPYGIEAKMTAPWNGTGPFSPGWVSMAGGGAAGPKLFPQGTAAGPGPVTRTNGSGGVSWTDLNVYPTTPGLGGPEKEIQFYVMFYNQSGGQTATSCQQFFLLSDPDHPAVGDGAYSLNCQDDVYDVKYKMDLYWETAHVSGDTYSFHVTAAIFSLTPDDGITGINRGPNHAITLTLKQDGHPDQAIDSGSTHWFDPSNVAEATANSWFEEDGVGGITFPTVNFDAIQGAAPAPYIEVDYQNLFGGTTLEHCRSTYNLTKIWATGNTKTIVTSIPFTDCSGATGAAHFTLGWQHDLNTEYWRPTSLTATLTGATGYHLAFPAGTSTTQGGIAYYDGPLHPVVTAKAASALAWGGSLAPSMTAPWDWVSLAGGAFDQAPGTITGLDSAVPYWGIKPNVVSATGVTCASAWPSRIAFGPHDVSE